MKEGRVFSGRKTSLQCLKGWFSLWNACCTTLKISIWISSTHIKAGVILGQVDDFWSEILLKKVRMVPSMDLWLSHMCTCMNTHLHTHLHSHMSRYISPTLAHASAKGYLIWPIFGYFTVILPQSIIFKWACSSFIWAYSYHDFCPPFFLDCCFLLRLWLVPLPSLSLGRSVSSISEAFHAHPL